MDYFAENNFRNVLHRIHYIWIIVDHYVWENFRYDKLQIPVQGGKGRTEPNL